MPNGIIIIDKPADWTSMDVCAKLRGLFRERRIGHAGTLDPMATGVLPVFVGRATRAVEFSAEGEKEYLAGLRLGVVTDTQDTSGRTLEEHPVTTDRTELEGVLPQFRGPIDQMPPMYSAIKINGQKLYDLARKGKEVERNTRPITIHSLEIESQESPTDYLIRVRCSKGTYVRTICHDIGAALGCGGTMYSLRRTMAADFTLEEAVTLDEVIQAVEEGRGASLLTSIDHSFRQYPSLTCTETEEHRFIRNGTPYPTTELEGTYRIYGVQGDFLMLGMVIDGQMKTIKSFFDVLVK